MSASSYTSRLMTVSEVRNLEKMILRHWSKEVRDPRDVQVCPSGCSLSWAAYCVGTVTHQSFLDVEESLLAYSHTPLLPPRSSACLREWNSSRFSPVIQVHQLTLRNLEPRSVLPASHMIYQLSL